MQKMECDKDMEIPIIDESNETSTKKAIASSMF